jgi:hypothetical protein
MFRSFIYTLSWKFFVLQNDPEFFSKFGLIYCVSFCGGNGKYTLAGASPIGNRQIMQVEFIT